MDEAIEADAIYVVHLLDRLPLRERRILELGHGLADGHEHTLCTSVEVSASPCERVRQLERQADLPVPRPDV